MASEVMTSFLEGLHKNRYRHLMLVDVGLQRLCFPGRGPLARRLVRQLPWLARFRKGGSSSESKRVLAKSNDGAGVSTCTRARARARGCVCVCVCVCVGMHL